MQRTGQGVDIIFRKMVSMGKPYPRYTDFGDAISLTICNSVIDLEYVKYIVEEQSKQQKILSLAKNKNGEYKMKSGKLVYVCFSSDFLIEDADVWRDECWKMIIKIHLCCF